MASDPTNELRQLLAEKIDEKMRSERMDDHFDGQDYADSVMELLRGALLTEPEHRAMRLTVDLWHALCRIAADGPARDGDLAELCTHIHAIQRTILAQAAARAYPNRYRLLGGHPPAGPEEATDGQ